MGLLKGLKSVSDRTDFMISDKMYNHIQIWLSLYKGHLGRYKDEPFHDIKYMTLNGPKKRRMLSLGMAKVVAQEMANLVFNEKCSISIDDKTYHENIVNVLDDNGFYDKFQSHLEYMFATGGMVIKVYSDLENIKLSFVHADAFIPLSDDGKTIREGIFVNESTKGKYYYTLLEFHVWEKDVYTIKNELYKSETKAEIGIKVPLSEMYGEMEEVIPIPGLKKPLFVYFKPNSANNVDLYSLLGVSLYSNSLDTLKTIDTIYDSYQREFRLGKKKTIVPASAIKAAVDENGNFVRYFDADNESYEAFNTEGDKELFHDVSPELRVQQHIDGINNNLNIIASQVGFSPGTFTFDTAGLKTATEVVSENSKTYRTRNGHITMIEEGLKDLIQIIGDVAVLYELFQAPDEYEVSISFDDSIAEDRNSNAAYWIMLTNSGIISKEYAAQKILKITEEEAVQMTAKAKADNEFAQVNPFGDGA
ncbi:phage portal protein [Niallia taxi]|uniref:phage portal protein n=1 Tax=Niallia taxi TaxID=2499688 RepID=UPI0031759A5B